MHLRSFEQHNAFSCSKKENVKLFLRVITWISREEMELRLNTCVSDGCNRVFNFSCWECHPKLAWSFQGSSKTTISSKVSMVFTLALAVFYEWTIIFSIKWALWNSVSFTGNTQVCCKVMFFIGNNASQMKQPPPPTQSL